MKPPTLKADFEAVEGVVTYPQEWRELSALTRADLLTDWIADLQLEYQSAVRGIFPEARRNSGHK